MAYHTMWAFMSRTWEMSWHLAEMGIYKRWELLSYHPPVICVFQLLTLVLYKCWSAEWQQDQESLVCGGFKCRHQHFFQVRHPCCTVKVNTKLTHYGGKKNYWQLRTAKIVSSKICIHATIYKIDSQWKFAVLLRELKLGLCNNLKG